MDIEKLFWAQIDPLYHLKQASCIRYARDIDQHYLLDDRPSKETPFGTELLDGFDEMKASALMFIRFHAIETLLTVLLGSYPHGPVPRFAKNCFGQKFNEAVEAVARGEIPAALRVPDVSDFNNWISTKFVGRMGDDDVLSDEVIKFISLQAALLGQKAVYNAFKHGCGIGPSAPELSFQDEKTGEWIPLVHIKSGVGWLGWQDDKKSKSVNVTIGAMSCDPERDHAAIGIMAMLVRAMKTIRLGEPGDQVSVLIPTSIDGGMSLPETFSVRVRFSPV